MGDDITTTLVADDEIDPGLRAAALEICRTTFGPGFTDDDAEHTAGGVRLLLFDEGLLVGHAAVVPRVIEVDERTLHAGYVEGVAVLPEHQGRGLGSRVMRAVNAVVERDSYDLGVLSTGRHAFYEQLGWQRWQGPSFVRHADGLVRTPEDDDGLLVLLGRRTPRLDLTAPIACHARAGDDW